MTGPTRLDALEEIARQANHIVPMEKQDVLALIAELRDAREQAKAELRAELAETADWEYGVGWSWGERTIAFRTDSREAAAEHVRRHPEDEGEPQFIVRRTPEVAAGLWEQVKS